MTLDEAIVMLFEDFKHSCDMMEVRRQEEIELINTIMKTIIRQHAVRCFYGRTKPM